MKKIALLSVPLCLFLAGSLGCVKGVRIPLPQFKVQKEPYKESLPPPAVPTNGKPSSVKLDPVKIQPEKAVGFQGLPTTVTEIFDQKPVPLSVRDVVVNTLDNNHQIKIEGYNLRIAEYEVPVSKGIYDLLTTGLLQYTRTEEQTSTAGFGSLGVNKSKNWLGQVQVQQLLPTGATASLAYTAAKTIFLVNDIAPVVDPVTGATIFVPNPRNVTTYSNQATFNITQPLLRGFGREITNAGIRIAQLERQGAAADFETNTETQIENALRTYWELLGWIENYKVQVISYAAARDLLRVNTAKFNAGVVARTEVLQAEAAAEARRDQVITARQQVRDLEDQLKRQIFLQPGTPLWNREIMPTQPIAWREIDVDLDKAIQVAMSERSEMRRARSNIQQSEVTQKVARNNILPQVNLFGQVTPNGLNDDFGKSFDTMNDGDYVSYNAGVQFAYPLQNRTARYRYKQAQARTAQTQEQLRDLQDQITLEVRQAVRELRTARERINVTQSQIRSAQATLDAERRRLEVGISTSFQVLQFQQDVATAQSQHIRAVVDYNEAAIRLERTRGTLLETFGVDVLGADLRPEAKPVCWPIGFN